ncbi:hypothetical protein BU15DRAFT_81084 [Melanogaster broomeanus]|nr:hypothetical protein BU15DRAFT_81084 [Melanogaster broomeanus]
MPRNSDRLVPGLLTELSHPPCYVNGHLFCMILHKDSGSHEFRDMFAFIPAFSSGLEIASIGNGIRFSCSMAATFTSLDKTPVWIHRQPSSSFLGFFLQASEMLSDAPRCSPADKYDRAYRLDRMALIRIEELAPFQFTYLADILKSYTTSSAAPAWLWVQEEPRNQGAWGHVKN